MTTDRPSALLIFGPTASRGDEAVPSGSKHTDMSRRSLRCRCEPRMYCTTRKGGGARLSNCYSDTTLGTSRMVARCRPSLSLSRIIFSEESIHRIYHGRHDILSHQSAVLVPTPRKRSFSHPVSFHGELTNYLCIHLDTVLHA